MIGFVKFHGKIIVKVYTFIKGPYKERVWQVTVDRW